MAVTAEGFFYVYKLDTAAGGECKMLSTYLPKPVIDHRICPLEADRFSLGENTLFESQSEEVGASYLE